VMGRATRNNSSIDITQGSFFKRYNDTGILSDILPIYPNGLRK